MIFYFLTELWKRHLTAARLSSHILYIYKHTLCYKIKSLTLLNEIKFTKQSRARTRRQDIMADMVTVGGALRVTLRLNIHIVYDSSLETCV